MGQARTIDFGFDQICTGPGRHCFRGQILVDEPGQHQHGRVGRNFFDAFEGGHFLAVGQHQIEQYCIDAALPEPRQADREMVGGFHGEGRTLRIAQQTLQEASVDGIVLNEQNGYRRNGHGGLPTDKSL